MDITLTLAKGANKGKCLRLRSRENVIGRATGLQVRIPAASVSRRHCKLTTHDGYVTVEDLDSANGTLVNGNRIKKQPLRPGDRLEIGSILFVVNYDLSPEAEERLQHQETPAFELVDVEPIEDAPELSVETIDIEPADMNVKKSADKPKAAKKTKPPDKEDRPSRKTKSDKKTVQDKKAPVDEEEEVVAIEVSDVEEAIELTDEDLKQGSGADVRDILSKLE